MGHLNDKVFKIQKKVIRIITKSKYNAHTEPLFKKMNILKYTDLVKLKAIKFYYKYCNNQLPEYFKSFILEPQQHNYNTRQNNNIRTFHTNTWAARNCLRHHLPEIINSFPSVHNIREKVHTHCLDGFTQYVKKACYLIIVMSVKY